MVNYEINLFKTQILMIVLIEVLVKILYDICPCQVRLLNNTITSRIN